MDRRTFTTRLMVAGATTSLVAKTPALANQNQQQDDGRKSVPGFGYIRLKTARQIIVPVRLIVTLQNDSRQLGIDLTLTFSIRNENRSGILTPTLKRNYRNADEVGLLRRAGNTLIANLTDSLVLNDVILLNQGTSFRIPGAKLARPVRAKLPMLGNLLVLGRIFRRNDGSAKKNELLIFVTPTILDDEM